MKTNADRRLEKVSMEMKTLIPKQMKLIEELLKQI